MGYKKEISVGCSKCGVLWNEDLSNKQPKRALCKECSKIEYAEYQKKRNSINSVTRTELYQPFKIENRKEIYKEASKALREMKNRDEWRAYMWKRLEKLLNDTSFIEYCKKQPQ